jgi:hypothetical protein
VDQQNFSVCWQWVISGLKLSEDWGSLGDDNEDFDIHESGALLIWYTYTDVLEGAAASTSGQKNETYKETMSVDIPTWGQKFMQKSG